MKTSILLLASVLLAGSASAQVSILSDFSNFNVDYYGNLGTGAWSDTTAQSNATTFTIGGGAETASGNIANSFIQFLGAPQNWTAYTSVVLTGSTLPTNLTNSIRFYIGDINDEASTLSQFSLASFTSGPKTISIPLLFGGIDKTQVTSWGFTGGSFGEPDFAFSFDKVAVMAVPEPATSAAVIGVLALLAVDVRRRLARSKKDVAQTC